jgi:glutathione S-transferase
MSEQLPILYSFRRCPYAMRARMALVIAGQRVELREVVLKEKPAEMIEASAKGTVPVLVMPDGRVIDESIDIMHWALRRSDPEGWHVPNTVEMDKLISDNDGPFKHHLDRFKYATRYEDADPPVNPEADRTAAEEYLARLDERLMANKHLMGDSRSLADIAIFPFVRQFMNAAKDVMEMSRFPGVDRWLKGHVASPLFASVMDKYPQWQPGEPGIQFP